MSNKTKIAVIFGGNSPEHDTSVAGGFSVIVDIDINKYEVYPVFVKSNGDFATLSESYSTLFEFINNKKNRIYLDPQKDIEEYKVLLENNLKDIGKLTDDITLKHLINKEFDIVFPVFHGKNGEDGSIQGLLDFLDVAYVGCGIAGSAVCIDKEITKKICEANKVRVVDYFTVKKNQWAKRREDILKDMEEKLSYPLFIKPVSLGSSIGITRANDKTELESGIENGFDYDTKIIVEKGLKVEEVSVSVIGNDEPIASEIALFKSLNEDFFDFESKYSENALSSVIPAPLSKETTNRVKETALEIYKFLEIYGFARIDFFIENEVLYLNEVNTIPGLDICGTFIKQWKKSGVEKKELIDKLINYGFEKFNEKQRLKNCF